MNTYFYVTNNRFFFIFGETIDEFCESNLLFANFHKILHKHLKKLNYKRVVFYKGTKGIYCFDQKSFCDYFENSKKNRRLRNLSYAEIDKIKKESKNSFWNKLW